VRLACGICVCGLGCERVMRAHAGAGTQWLSVFMRCVPHCLGSVSLTPQFDLALLQELPTRLSAWLAIQVMSIMFGACNLQVTCQVILGTGVRPSLRIEAALRPELQALSKWGTMEQDSGKSCVVSHA